MPTYLGSLTLRLAAGALRLPEEFRRRHGAFLAAAQNAEYRLEGLVVQRVLEVRWEAQLDRVVLWNHFAQAHLAYPLALEALVGKPWDTVLCSFSRIALPN